MRRPTLSTQFGQLLKKRREELGLSQEALASRARVHRTYVGLVERGLRNTSLDVASRLAEAVGRRLSEIVREAETKA